MAKEAVGLVVKRESSLAEETALRIVKFLEDRGYDILVDVTVDSPRLNGYPRFDVSRWSPEKVIVVGGDGTLLRTFLRLGEKESPIFMAVKAGKRGFLLDVERYEVEERLRDFVEGKYKVYTYTRLSVFLNGEKKGCIFNDAVVVAKNAKMARLQVQINGEIAMNIDGDGVILATTAGSTAYSLSAGGPIIDPRLDVVVVTPLNPVQLYLRPIVAPSQSRVRVDVSPQSNEMILSLDGQVIYEVPPGSSVTVERCKSPIRIARFKWWEMYYERLFTRLITYW